MSKYTIKNIQCGLSACGLCADTVNVEVEFQEESGKSIFVSNVEFDGFPNVFKTEESIFQKLMNYGAESEDAADELDLDERNELEMKFKEDLDENYSIFSGDGYEEFYDDQECGGDLHDAIRFVIYVTRSEWEEIDRCKAEYEGKAIGDFEIPKCDAERAWEQGVELGEEEE